MTRNPKHDVLFEPMRIGPKTLKNRFYQVPHCMGAGVEKPGMQASFRGMKAEGGWAAVCTEYCSIHPESDDTYRISVCLWDEGDVRNLAPMCEAVHRWDALAGVELWYGGPHAPCLMSRTVPRAPSQIASEFEFMSIPLQMSKTDIRDVQGFYVQAAVRARSAGFDIIDLHGALAHGVLMQFLSPFYNKRTDEYGGSLRNRARFWMECLEKVREAVGDDCAITTRISVDGIDLPGTRTEETLEFIELADQLVDMWNVNLGSMPVWAWDIGPSRLFSENHQKPWTELVKPHTRHPVIGVGRFTNPDSMATAITSGQLDIIGAARPSISDPFLPTKVAEGRLEDIRECIGCNICASRWERGGPIVCTQNATSGEEYRRGWHPEHFEPAANADLDVLVVGAGPAGMECAMVLGKRGMHRVHLIDARAEMGGIMRWIPRLPGLGEWARVVDYRKIQIDKLKNVEFIPGTELDAQATRQYGAEIVIIATGARWTTDGLNGFTHDPIPGADASQPNCLTPEQIMVEGKQVPGPRVLVYDCDGYFMGASLAEKLARDGKQVTFMTPLQSFAPYMLFTGEDVHVYRLLRELGVEIITQRLLTQLEAGRAVTTDAYYEADESTREIDSVVLVTQRVSNEGLYGELAADPAALEGDGVKHLLRIGDCVAPRLIADCVFDGHRLAREIDSADPAVPLQFIRERRLVGSVSDSDYDAQLASGAVPY